MASYDEQQVLDLGKNPIPGGDPCGSDVADDEQYIEVDAQISGLDRIESEEPDWYMIEQSTINILSSKSKDVEMAAAHNVEAETVSGRVTVSLPPGVEAWESTDPASASGAPVDCDCIVNVRSVSGRVDVSSR